MILDRIDNIYDIDDPNMEKSNHKTDEEVALEVLNGLWGNGAERKAKLEENGYDYNKIQNMLNEAIERIASENTTSNHNTSIDNIINELSRIIEQLEDLKLIDQEISGHIRYNIDISIKTPKEIRKHTRCKINI